MPGIATSATTRTAEPPSLMVLHRERAEGRPIDPDARRDLLIDQLVARLTREREEYDLEPWLTTLVPAADVGRRHEVFSDLETPALRRGLSDFSADMRHVRRVLEMAAKRSHTYERQRWSLEASRRYIDTVKSLAATLREAPPRSAALQGVSAWLKDYVASPSFSSLSADTSELVTQFDAISYRVRLHGDAVEVRPVQQQEPELASRVEAIFERFRQGAAKSYLQEIRDPGSMDHVEAAIASFVARLHPEAFASLSAFAARHQSFVATPLTWLEREVQFFLAFLELEAATAGPRVRWSLPHIAMDGHLSVQDGVDVVMLLGGPVGATVPNDCELNPDERLVVVTGPNQGGKTTFARMAGQLHVLTAIGVPVPAAAASVPLADQVFTIFERGENLADLRGHLHDDLTRAHELLENVTPESLVLLNEVYSSTTPDDALVLARDLLGRLGIAGARTVCVTFLDELTRLSPTTVSMVAGVDPVAPSRRTYRLERRAADGQAYARALAQQHRLTGEDLRRRLAR